MYNEEGYLAEKPWSIVFDFDSINSGDENLIYISDLDAGAYKFKLIGRVDVINL